MGAQTLFEKIWNRHVVSELGDGYALLYVSRHLKHDGGSRAFLALKERGLAVRNPGLTFAAFDHNPALTPLLYSMRARGRASV